PSTASPTTSPTSPGWVSTGRSCSPAYFDRVVVDIAGDDRFPPVEGPDLYLYLHPDGVLSVTSSDGRVQQLPLPAVIDAVHAAQDDDGTVWVSGPDSPLGLGALDAILETGPVPLQPWSATA